MKTANAPERWTPYPDPAEFARTCAEQHAADNRRADIGERTWAQIIGRTERTVAPADLAPVEPYRYTGRMLDSNESGAV